MKNSKHKFINIQSDHSQNIHLFLTNFKSHISKSNSGLTKFTSNPNISKSFSKLPFTTVKSPLNFPSPSQELSSKPNTFKNFTSLSQRNNSECSHKAFSPIERQYSKVNENPNSWFPQANLDELLSKEFDQQIHFSIENHDTNLLNQLQTSRLIKVKNLAHFLIKEFESSFNKTPTPKQIFLTDLLRLLQADFCKIIHNYINFFESKQNISDSLKRSTSKRKTTTVKNDLMSIIQSIFHLISKIYPKIQSKAPLTTIMLNELNCELEKMKLDLRMQDFDERAYGFVNLMEEHIKTIFESMELHLLEIENLNSQIKHYEQLHEGQYYLMPKSNTQEILKKALNSESLNSRGFSNDGMNGVELLNDKIAILEKKVIGQNEEIERKDLLIHDLQDKVKELESKINYKPHRNHKQTQATSYSVEEPSKQINSNDSNTIIERMLDKALVGFKLTFDCSLSLISLILNDKLIQDHYDMKEKILPLPLQPYIYQWFLVRLGSSRLTKVFITDFFSSIFQEKQARFKNFITLTGVQPYETQTQSNTNKNTNKISFLFYRKPNTPKSNYIKPASEAFIRSPLALKIFLKTFYLIKFSNLRVADRYAPLFPMLDPEINACSFVVILSVLRQILKEEEFPEEFIEESTVNFQEHFVNNNETLTKKVTMSPGLYDRVKSNIFEKTVVDFDSFALYLLEWLGSKFEKKIEAMIKALDLVGINRNCSEGFPIDEFRGILMKQMPKKQKAWFDRFLLSFSTKNLFVTSGSLKEMLLNALDDFLQIDGPYISSKDKEKKLERKASIEVKSRLSKKKNNDNAISKNNNYNLGNEISQSKEKIDLEQDIFKIDHYDIVNDIIVLNELYDLVIGMILKAENKNENLFINHQVFKKEFMKLPNVKLFKNAKVYSKLLVEYDRKILIDGLEKVWTFFRVIFEALGNEKEKRN